MASGGGNSGFSSMSGRNNVPPYYSPNRNASFDSRPRMDPEQMTLAVVDEFKRRMQDKVERREPITQSIAESAVAEIKQTMNPGRYDISRWKRQLPSEIRACPDRILRESMAYGDDAHQARSVLQTKLHEAGANGNSIDASLDNIVEPLKRLRDELARTPLTDLFRAVRDVDGQDNDRGTRLFMSEALHFVPGLQRYTFTSAQNAVKAIRETHYQSENPLSLLTILKTCDGYEDIRGYMEKNKPKPGMRQNEPARATTTTTTSSFANDSNANRRNDSFNGSGFNGNMPPSYKPLGNSSHSSSQFSGPPVQPSSNTRNDHRDRDLFPYDFDRT